MKKTIFAVALAMMALQPAAFAASNGAELWPGGGHHGGGWGPGYPGPHQVVCYAQNLRGDTFRAFGLFPERVQDEAMWQCERYSFRCRPLGCNWY